MKSLLTRRAWLASASLAACTLASAMNLPSAHAAEDTRVFEMRVYVTNPGKLPNLLKRFRELKRNEARIG